MNTDSLKRQYTLSWDALDELLAKCPESLWTVEVIENCSVAKLAFHTIQTVQRYCRPNPKKPAEMDPFNFGGNANGTPADKLPALQDMQAYSQRSRKRLMQWLDSLDDAQLAESSKSFLWTSKTTGERLIYTLKHIDHHLGQMNLILRLHGTEAAGWRCVKE